MQKVKPPPSPRTEIAMEPQLRDHSRLRDRVKSPSILVGKNASFRILVMLIWHIFSGKCQKGRPLDYA